MTNSYQICTRCLMDTSAADIKFDVNGVCSYCRGFINRSGHILNMSADTRNEKLDLLIKKVKKQGARKRYDCIVGVSGGVDSSWVLAQVVKLGLRPLAVHMDNGWNTELAQNNIANLVRGLGVDLYTHVIDWEEYRNLMQALFDADVIDIELLYDNAMRAVNYQQAAKYGLKHILAGTNQATEGILMPKNWAWFKLDKRNIKFIARKFGNIRLNTFPAIGTVGYIWNELVRGIHWTPLLDLLPYNKFEALDTLQRKFCYKPYPYKHYESVFTRFYQGYILPKKFKVDKRRLHLSTLIISGQITREQACADLEGIAYPTEKELEEDKQYFFKKMGWTRDQFEEYCSRPEKSHLSYSSERPLWDSLTGFYDQVLRKRKPNRIL